MNKRFIGMIKNQAHGTSDIGKNKKPDFRIHGKDWPILLTNHVVDTLYNHILIQSPDGK